ncbi:hypothetical protein ARMSODRAFT_976151 [Armillaria solidipes]|uniref:Uncharacterized protein n=1 Tax=Armillaria solidipes TaxID=1076256 RepID=A0A2H3BQK7_9AGAR|nr:hypothetical protein ARMSODRAFT_976151 [Armillaria solidipes]
MTEDVIARRQSRQYEFSGGDDDGGHTLEPSVTRPWHSPNVTRFLHRLLVIGKAQSWSIEKKATSSMRSAASFTFGFLSPVGQSGRQSKTLEAISVHRREELGGQGLQVDSGVKDRTREKRMAKVVLSLPTHGQRYASLPHIALMMTRSHSGRGLVQRSFGNVDSRYREQMKRGTMKNHKAISCFAGDSTGPHQVNNNNASKEIASQQVLLGIVGMR